MSAALLTTSALELAALVRRGEVSAAEVVDAHIERCQAVNPVINAIVAERYAAAAQEARAIDVRRQRGETLEPLAGVPFTIKEMLDWRGMPSTFGCSARRDRRAESDAVIVQRLRAAGAIPLASTNIPEWGLWYETSNLIYGRTNNPHDVARTTGGSSGGEAAVVASRGSAFGLGSDIGGSIRIPAAFCGVYGHKPTNGLLPLTGHYPVYASGPDAAISKRNPWVVVGPITRSARDLMPILRVCAGVDAIDPNVESIELSAEPVSWRDRAVYVLEDPHIRFAGRAQPEMISAVRAAARALEQRGAIVQEAPIALFRDIVELWFTALESSTERVLAQLLATSGTISITRELAAFGLRRARYTFPVLGFAALEKLLSHSRTRIDAALQRIARLQTQFQQLVGTGVLLLPPHPRPAPKHHRALLHPFAFAYTAAFNLLRVPATVAPVGLTSDGLPTSVQIVAARGNDPLTIAAACVFEDEFGPAKLPDFGAFTSSLHTQPR